MYELNFNIKPNPVDNYFTLKLDFKDLNESVVFKLYDMVGKEIYQQKFSSTQTEETILTSQWASGMYSYQIVSNNHVVKSGKLVKE